MMYFRNPKPHLNVVPINTLIEDPLDPSFRASEPAEVEFIDENGGGQGVRLKNRQQKKSAADGVAGSSKRAGGALGKNEADFDQNENGARVGRKVAPAAVDIKA